MSQHTKSAFIELKIYDFQVTLKEGRFNHSFQTSFSTSLSITCGGRNWVRRMVAVCANFDEAYTVDESMRQAVQNLLDKNYYDVRHEVNDFSNWHGIDYSQVHLNLTELDHETAQMFRDIFKDHDINSLNANQLLLAS